MKFNNCSSTCASLISSFGQLSFSSASYSYTMPKSLSLIAGRRNYTLATPMYMSKGNMVYLTEGSTGRIASDYSGSANYSDCSYTYNQSCIAPACQNPFKIIKLNMTFYIRVLVRYIDSPSKRAFFH